MNPLLPASVALVLSVKPASPPPPSCTYDVEAGPEARELSVDLRLGPGFSGPLVVSEGFAAYLSEVEVERDGRLIPLSAARGAYPAPTCPAGCRVRYRFRLEDAARGLHNRSSAFENNGAFVVSPGGWLLRPENAPEGARYVLKVRAPAPTLFVTGIFPAGPDAYEGLVSDLGEAPYSAFGPFEMARVEVQKGVIDVALGAGPRRVAREDLLKWVAASGRAVAGYFGGFPLPRALVMVLPGGRRGVGFGTTMGNGGGSIMVWVGKNASSADLDQDWVLTHEMVHLSVPNLAGRQWLEEGIATYVEPIARARAGILAPTEVWSGLVKGLPQGQPRSGDHGLDNTHTWGRIYWGGALFCFMADLEIRDRTQNRRSLDDALRRILAAGGNIAVDWEIDRLLKEGDMAAGVPVLQELYSRLAHKPVSVDLESLWKRLGIAEDSGRLAFDDAAPWAAIRRSITASPQAPPGP